MTKIFFWKEENLKSSNAKIMQHWAMVVTLGISCLMCHLLKISQCKFEKRKPKNFSSYASGL